jgi:hypothetical protein
MSDVGRIMFWIGLLLLALAIAGSAAEDAGAQERFGDGAAWVHHRADGSTQKYRNENGCWHAHFSQEILTGSYCEPDKEWLMVEQTEFGVDTTGFKSEIGCFIGGIIASHQQGVAAQCMYIGGSAANGVPRRGRASQ